MNLPEFFGLDIGNHSIKVAQVKVKAEKTAELEAIGHVSSDHPLVGATDPAVKQAIAARIKQVREAAGIKTNKVITSLPESAIFSKIITVPDLPEDQLEQLVFYEARNHLPIAPGDVQMDYIPLNKKEVDGHKLMQILLIAAPKTLVNLYIEVLHLAGLEPLAMETETVATARTLTFAGDMQGNAMVMDFGSKGIDVSVIKGKSIVFSQSLGTGSDALTKAIASDFSLEYMQAEQYKRTYGLLTGQADGKIAKALEPIMLVIVNEINKTINYFRAHLQESTPNRLILVGEGAKLPGLATYLSSHLGIQAQLVDPVANLQISPRIKSEVSQLATVGFTVAVGLALKQS